VGESFYCQARGQTDGDFNGLSTVWTDVRPPGPPEIGNQSINQSIFLSGSQLIQSINQLTKLPTN